MASRTRTEAAALMKLTDFLSRSFSFSLSLTIWSKIISVNQLPRPHPTMGVVSWGQGCDGGACPLGCGGSGGVRCYPWGFPDSFAAAEDSPVGEMTGSHSQFICYLNHNEQMEPQQLSGTYLGMFELQLCELHQVLPECCHPSRLKVNKLCTQR